VAQRMASTGTHKVWPKVMSTGTHQPCRRCTCRADMCSLCSWHHSVTERTRRSLARHTRSCMNHSHSAGLQPHQSLAWPTLFGGKLCISRNVARQEETCVSQATLHSRVFASTIGVGKFEKPLVNTRFPGLWFTRPTASDTLGAHSVG
jgi:hypothetical protein